MEPSSVIINSSDDVEAGPNSTTATADTAGDESVSLTVIDEPPPPPWSVPQENLFVEALHNNFAVVGLLQSDNPPPKTPIVSSI